MLRQTIIVHNRNAWRTHRTQAAIDAQQGLQLCTMEQLAARLAGGFLQPIDDDALNLALAAALVTPLGDLDAIKALPGFQRAAAATLGQAWTAGWTSQQRWLQQVPERQRRVLVPSPLSRERCSNICPRTNFGRAISLRPHWSMFAIRVRSLAGLQSAGIPRCRRSGDRCFPR